MRYGLACIAYPRVPIKNKISFAIGVIPKQAVSFDLTHL